MKSVVLVFPDVTTMAEYILKQRVSQVQTDSTAITITGVLPDEKIAKACTDYGGEIINMVGTKYEE
jgi:hypothetical protein